MGQVAGIEYEVKHFDGAFEIEHNIFSMIKETWVPSDCICFDSNGKVFESKEPRNKLSDGTYTKTTDVKIDDATMYSIRRFLGAQKEHELYAAQTKVLIDEVYKIPKKQT